MSGIKFDNQCICTQKQEIEEILVNLTKTHEKLDNFIKVIEKRMDKLDHVLFGNGRPGLISRLDKLEGGIGLFKWLVGLSILGPILTQYFISII